MTNLFDLSGKVAIITGASRGIGEAIAEAFVEAGAKVVLSSRKQEGLDPVAAGIRAKGGEAIAIAAHNGDKAALQALAKAVWRLMAGSTFWSITRRPIRILEPCWKPKTACGRKPSRST